MNKAMNIAITVTLIALLLAPLAGLNAAEPVKPNILHIHADDHRSDGLRCLGNPLLVTPNLDSLAERGMIFTHCYTMGSMVGVCLPSRTMLLTGRSWQRIPGAPDASPNAADPTTFLPEVMAAAGYRSWHMGKSGNGFTTGLKAFETNIIDDARGKTPENDRVHACQRLADRTIESLKSRQASGEWTNTIVVFSGDNGLSLGEHGLFGKQNLYEFGGMHVPLVIAGPGISHGKSDSFVYLMDLFPTFAEFGGAKIPDGVEGQSLVPLLTGKETKRRDVLYTGYRTCQRSIRDDRITDEGNGPLWRYLSPDRRQSETRRVVATSPAQLTGPIHWPPSLGPDPGGVLYPINMG